MSDYQPTEIFIKYLLEKSLSQDPKIAKNEWEYYGLIKHLDGIQSTCVLESRLNTFSWAFYNVMTHQIFHANSKSQYFFHRKGRDQDKIIKTDPNGDGTSNHVNKGMLNKILNFVENVYNEHNQNKVKIESIRKIYKYKYVLENINILEQEQLNNILFKINWLINNFYNINFCNSCCDFYLSKVKQSEYRTKCLRCYNSNDVCFLKLINK